VAFDATKPTGKNKIKDSDNFIVANFTELETALARTHTFPGTYGSTAGKHKPGECSPILVGTEADLAALDDIANGIGFATDAWQFYVNNGAGFVARQPSIPTGEVMIFPQANAPLGWTLVTDFDDGLAFATSATSAGGDQVSGGSWTLSGLTHDHTHVLDEVPQHNHGVLVMGAAGTTYSVLYTMHTYTAINATHVENAGVDTPTSDSPGDDSVSSDALWRPQSRAVIQCQKD
jgi:hypothetical protein